MLAICLYTYTDEKKFAKAQTQRLFLLAGWVSGQYPEPLMFLGFCCQIVNERRMNPYTVFQ